jgi:uncharacterized membrane protein
MYVPVDWVEPVDIAFDELLNVYMSLGATSADCLARQSTLQVKQAGSSPDFKS